MEKLPMVGNQIDPRPELLIPHAIIETLAGDPPTVGGPSFWSRVFNRKANQQRNTHDTQLQTGLDLLMHDVEIEDIAVPFDDRPIRSLESFGLIPLVGNVINGCSLEPAQDRLKLPEGIESRYYNGTRYGLPYLDTHQALGLIFKNRLIAVSGAGIDVQDRLRIVQIQDVTSIRKYAGKQYYKTGLQQGLLWRDSLVGAWELIGQKMGIEQSVIQAGANNRWRKRWNAHFESYDEVAERLGYTLEKGKKPDWVKDLQ